MVAAAAKSGRPGRSGDWPTQPRSRRPVRHERRRRADRDAPSATFVRIAWVLHRALFRFSRGRIGLRPPEAGSRFGMMRLMTIGRRSGQPRVAIVGYYEDGPNLVTLAMNGWAEAEPAWWLNLQAQPDTTVELTDGRRAVRGRAAEGEERDRLWARWGEFSDQYDAGRRCAPGRPRSSCSSRASPQRSPGSHPLGPWPG